MKKVLLCLVLICCGATCFAQMAAIPSGVYHWADASVVKSKTGEVRHFMEGTTAELSYFKVQAITQKKDAIVKEVRVQKDLECFLFVKEGDMKITIGTQSSVLGKGSIAVVPPQQLQQIESVGNGPLTYYMFQFRSKQPVDMQRSANAGGPLMLNADTLVFKPSAVGGGIKYIRKPTAMLNELEMHITELKGKGPSHAPHTHVDTEIILMLEGRTEQMIDCKTYQGLPGDIYLMNSQQFHGISNIQDTPCRYLAIRWK